MPAPLAKGLIITLSVLFAAGVAVYENPQVRQWVDESRRKVAMALYSLGDELSPTSGSSWQDDVSTREDDSPEAVERRRQARQDILERGRRLEELRKSRQYSSGQGQSFNDLVDRDGNLKPQSNGSTTPTTGGHTTATENLPNDSHVRQRNTEAKAANLGSRMANPFADEMQMDDYPLPSHERVRSPPLPPKPAAYQPRRLVRVETPVAADVDTRNEHMEARTETETVSNHPSEQLVDLTPTTSAPGSPRSTTVPTSIADHADLASLRPLSPQSQDRSATQSESSSTYLSINEWAMNQSRHLPVDSRQPQQIDPVPQQQDPFIPADLERAMSDFLSQSSHENHDIESAPSEIDSRYGVLSHDGFTDYDGESGVGEEEEGGSQAEKSSASGIRTPSTWTEVGSQVSEDF